MCLVKHHHCYHDHNKVIMRQTGKRLTKGNNKRTMKIKESEWLDNLQKVSSEICIIQIYLVHYQHLKIVLWKWQRRRGKISHECEVEKNNNITGIRNTLESKIESPHPSQLLHLFCIIPVVNRDINIQLTNRFQSAYISCYLNIAASPCRFI